MLYDHYKYTAEPRDAGASLKATVAASREREAREEAERQRDSHFRHKATMERFRAWVRRQEYFSEADQAEIIKASFIW
jgi:hypothetical protein